MEGDAKLVVETLLKNTDDVSWDIAGIISDALVLASSFSSCKFGRIKRDGNTVAHMLATFASQSKLVVCNNELIPQVVREAWWKELEGCSVFFLVVNNIV